jgi:ankyrin repeat protein
MMNEGKDGIDLINGGMEGGSGLEGESESSLGNMDTTTFTATDSGIDYTKNTPLLWATHCGHLRVIWLLLSDGYSPNDVDKMMNNAVHLAAAFGDVKILQVLINDGGNANAVNYYKNKPIDMAKNKAVRDMVAVAMETGASMTDDDRRVKHEQNLRQVSVEQSFFLSFLSYLCFFNSGCFCALFCLGLLKNYRFSCGCNW